MCKIFASELGSKLGVMRGFQKGITLGGRTSGSVRKVCVGGVVGCWIMESLCLPTEVFCDLYVTFTLLVKVRVRLRRQESVGRQVVTILVCHISPGNGYEYEKAPIHIFEQMFFVRHCLEGQRPCPLHRSLRLLCNAFPLSCFLCCHCERKRRWEYL